MLTFTTLASSSSGNASLVSCGDTHILLDAGVSARRITTGLTALGVAPEALSAIFITHEHSDHIAGLQVLSKKLRVPIYATAPTCRQLCRKTAFLEELVRAQGAGTGIQIGSLWVESFATPHDAAGSVGYSITGEGGRMVLCTDLGYVTEEVRRAAEGCDLLVCEANHDEDWVKSGPYPYYLKQRILGDHGHLSNEAGAELAARAVETGTRMVVLAHLSQQNNTPARAYEVVSRRLRAMDCRPGEDIALSVAPRAELGTTYHLEGGGRMLSVYVICVGKLKEKFYKDACAEYVKRLSAYCKLTLVEIPEVKLPQKPTLGEIAVALDKEGDAIRQKIPPSSRVAALCVEGRMRSSEELPQLFPVPGRSQEKHMVFLIGGSYGLHPSIKAEAQVQLSMSPMTFPHHLARVMLLEQIYRAFKIQEGSSYHK